MYVNTRRSKVPLRWLSIEAMRDSLYSSKSDVWAFAVLLWEIGTLGESNARGEGREVRGVDRLGCHNYTK